MSRKMYKFIAERIYVERKKKKKKERKKKRRKKRGKDKTELRRRKCAGSARSRHIL